MTKRAHRWTLAVALSLGVGACMPGDGSEGLEIAVTVPVAHDTAYDGRLVLLISADTSDATEPRQSG